MKKHMLPSDPDALAFHLEQGAALLDAGSKAIRRNEVRPWLASEMWVTAALLRAHVAHTAALRKVRNLELVGVFLMGVCLTLAVMVAV